MKNKKELRSVYSKKRQDIPLNRRKLASTNATRFLIPQLSYHSYVLSYASFGSELNTWQLNHYLAQAKKLIFPKVEGDSLRFFLVTDLHDQLKKNRWGFLEPSPELCPEVNPSSLSLALVPGLAFDRNNHRLGYGKGYYDRFLCKHSQHLCSIGLGFLEQQSPSIPTFPTDVPLTQVVFF